MLEKDGMAETRKPPETAAFEGESLSEGLSELSHPNRIARLSFLKSRSVSMSSWLGAHNDHVLAVQCHERLRACANWMLFHHYFTVEEIRLAQVYTCQIHLLCPFCAHARAMKTLTAYLDRYKLISVEHPHLKLAMLTVTVKNGESLPERFKHLRESWKKYCNRRRDSLKKNRGYCELSKISGAFFSYEFSKSADGWHPHLHAIVLLDRWIDQKKLADEWQGITGDSRIVDIRRIKGDPFEGFAEVCKYALKFSSLDESDTFHAYQALHGRRLQGSFGCFRNVTVPEKLTDDLLDLPHLDLLYKYRHGAGYSLAHAPVKRDK
jgi:hypothetical protein